MKVGDEDGGSDPNGNAGRDRAEHHDLASITDVVVNPDLLEAFLVRQRSKAHEVPNGMLVGEMNDKLETELALKDRHSPQP